MQSLVSDIAPYHALRYIPSKTRGTLSVFDVFSIQTDLAYVNVGMHEGKMYSVRLQHSTVMSRWEHPALDRPPVKFHGVAEYELHAVPHETRVISAMQLGDVVRINDVPYMVLRPMHPVHQVSGIMLLNIATHQLSAVPGNTEAVKAYETSWKIIR